MDSGFYRRQRAGARADGRLSDFDMIGYPWRETDVRELLTRLGRRRRGSSPA